MQKIVIISAASFFRAGPRVGMQFIAQVLARAGYEIHYVSQPSSPMDALSPARWSRFQRSWLSRTRSRAVEPNLTEHFVCAPFPVAKAFWKLQRQFEWYGALLPGVLKRMRFDLCLHDVSSCFPLLEHLSFAKKILRLSDRPEGFGYAASGTVIERLVQEIAADGYEQTWPVSEPLRDYAVGLQPAGEHYLISNGVDVERFMREPAGDARPKSALFVGDLARWFDGPLLDAAARTLPDWTFDLYGPAKPAHRMMAGNVVYKGPIDYRDLPRALTTYQVGLIPFRDEPLTAMMERPLKFYEYLAAGLGIASTDVGMLRKGMGDWARFGRTAQDFADAVRLAADDHGHNLFVRHAYLQEYSWAQIGARILSLVERALAPTGPLRGRRALHRPEVTGS